jgi:hypothetical protein
MKLVKHWRTLWKTYSVIFSGILVTLSAAQQYLPMIQTALDAKTFGLISFVIGVAILVGRYIEQQSVVDYKKGLESNIQDKAE